MTAVESDSGAKGSSVSLSEASLTQIEAQQTVPLSLKHHEMLVNTDCGLKHGAILRAITP